MKKKWLVALLTFSLLFLYACNGDGTEDTNTKKDSVVTPAASALTSLPIYTFHGDKDSVAPASGTRTMVQAIRDAGGSLIQHEEIPNCDHNSWDYAATKEG